MGKLKALGRFTRCIRLGLSYVFRGYKHYTMQGVDTTDHGLELFTVRAKSRKDAVWAAETVGFKDVQILTEHLPYELHR